MPGMRFVLRAGALGSSLALLIGCVWFAQKQARPAAMPGSKSALPSLPMAPEQRTLMSGSKSFSGPVIKGETLQTIDGKPAPQSLPSR